MEKFNRETLIPGASLVFNIASMINISNFVSSISSEFKAAPMNQILEGTPQLLTLFGIVLGPWFLAIMMSRSMERKNGTRLFSIITVITCILIVGFEYTGPSEGIGYYIAIQIIIAWVTIGICSLIKTKADVEKI